MVTIQVKSAQSLEKYCIHSICALKNKVWPHTLESQLNWWKNYTCGNDLCIFSTRDETALSFLRLRTRTILINEVKVVVSCITEVCVDENLRGSGVGSAMMATATNIINRSSSRIGYLLCNAEQENFYLSCGWATASVAVSVSSDEGRRKLRKNEKCMAYDPRGLLKGSVVLIGASF